MTSTEPSSTRPALLRSPPSAAAPLVLAGLAAALFARTLGNGFVNWDDPRYVLANPFATRGFAGIPAAWITSYDDAYYPLTHTLDCIVQAIAGPSPFAHHLAQLALWAVAVALVPAALAAFRVPRAVGFWAAVLWAVHPLRVESVSWAANLKDTLSVALVLGSFALYGTGWRRGSAIAFLLALLAKATVFPVAGLFVLLAWRDGASLRRATLRALPWLGPALAIAVVAAGLHLGGGGRTVPGGSLAAAIPSVLWLPWWYLGRILLPTGSQAVYVFAPVGWLDVRLAVGVGLWGAAIAAALRWQAGTPRDRALALAAWVLPFLPVTGLVPLFFPVADRYSLLPSLAATAVLALLVAGVLERRPRLAPAAAAVLGLASAGLAAASAIRQGEWRDGVALWTADVARDPDNLYARITLAGARGLERSWSGVEEQARAIAAIAPAGPTPRALAENVRQARGGARQLLDLGGSALKENRPEVAAVVLDALMRLAESAPARALAAQAEERIGQPERAIADAERALALSPAREDAVVTRALALADLRRFEEALSASEARLSDPRQQALLLAVRAFAFSSLGREDEARRALAAAQALSGRTAGAPGAP